MGAFVTVAVSGEEVRYVTDSLRLEARTGPDTSFKIVRMLPSGTEVRVLERRSGYSHVRFGREGEGWILTRYLQKEAAARDRLSRAEQTEAELKARNSELAARLQAAERKAEETQTGLEAARKEKAGLESELEEIKKAAASTLDTQRLNRRLTAKVARLQEDLGTLSKEAKSLRDGRQQQWFMAGAGVLGAGILVGLVVPRLTRRKRRSWSDF